MPRRLPPHACPLSFPQVNKVSFSVSGLGLIRGSLTISASYRQAGPQRVDITFLEAALVPSELQTLFQANYDLLLSIFNPQAS